MALNRAMPDNMHPKFRLQDAIRIKDVEGDQLINVMHRTRLAEPVGVNFMQQRIRG